MRHRAVAGLVVLLTGAGLWLLVEGVWIHAKARLAQHLIGRAWSAVRPGDRAARPWPWADTRPVARLEAPRHGIAQIVLSGASGRNLAFGPAWLDGTAPPGLPGVTVIAGHRDTHFRFLETIAAGDPLVLTGEDGRPHRYRVVAAEVADGRTARLSLAADRPHLVLVTCYPFDAAATGGPLRYVVTAAAE